MQRVIVRGAKKYLEQMKNLWRDTFGDTDEFIDLFFEKFYRPCKTFLMLEGSALVSMLFYMDVKVKYDGKRLRAAYLYGVATKLSERRQGHFTALHNALLEELTSKKYDLIITIPQNDSLFSFYKETGYTLPLRRCEFSLHTLDLTPVEDPHEVWLLKKELHKKARSGFSLLESEEQFLETVRDHKLFRYDGGYLAFYPKNDGYVLYGIISDDPSHAPVELVHYERSALMRDITGKLDYDRIDKEKPVLAFLMS